MAMSIYGTLCVLVLNVALPWSSIWEVSVEVSPPKRPWSLSQDVENGDRECRSSFAFITIILTSCYRCTGEWYAASFNTGKIQRCSKVATSDFKRHSQEGEFHPKASSPACRLFPVVWATSVGGKVNRNHRPITFDCCQWFLDPIGCQKCNPQVKIQGALNPISHSSIQSSCII